MCVCVCVCRVKYYSFWCIIFFSFNFEEREKKIIINKYKKKIKRSVRVDTLSKLANLFQTHVVPSWSQGQALHESRKKFLGIPQRILSAMNVSDVRSLTEMLMDEKILDSSLEMPQRMQVLSCT